MITTASYLPRKAKIVERHSLSPTSVGLRLAFTNKKPFHFSPGQYVMLSVLGFGEIPIGITTAPDEKGYFEVAIKSVGMVSQKITSLRPGEFVGVRGPFGHGYPLAKLKQRDVYLIGGGIGIFPLRSLIRHYLNNPKALKSLTVLYGAKTPEMLCFKDEVSSWRKKAKVILTVDKPSPDWKGETGLISDNFDKLGVKRGAVIIVCGPPALYPGVITRYAGKTVSEDDLYFLLERKMKCGIGKCQHCTCGRLYVCTDGPCFPYSKIKYNHEAIK